MKLRELYVHTMYLLARAHTYFYIKSLCVNDGVACNIVAYYCAVQYKFKSHTTYLPTVLSWERVWTI